MERGASRVAARLGVLVALALAVVAPVSSSARGADERTELSGREAALAEREAGVLAQLTALESRLNRARAELTALRSRALVLAAARRDAARGVRFAREDFATAQQRLAARLRTIYAEGDPDPLVVLLGAPSIGDALAALDGLEATAEADRELVDRLRATGRRLRARARTLARRSRELRTAEGAAAARVAALAGARAERDAYLARIRTERRLTASALEALERRARRPTRTPVPVTHAAPAEGVAVGARTLTVVASAYALRGPTATGSPAGWGTVAVDPAVIPLGTVLTVPGYGTGIAADVGGAIRGAAIDVWFPSGSEARAWGRRVVTITLAGPR